MNPDMKRYSASNSNELTKEQLVALIKTNFARTIERTILIEDSEKHRKNIGRFVQMIAAGGIPWIISNHRSHADGLIHALIGNQIRTSVNQIVGHEILRKFLMPISSTLAQGGQSEDLKLFFEILNPLMIDHGYQMIPIATRNDIAHRGAKRSDNKDSFDLIKQIPALQYGYSVMQEASVAASRDQCGMVQAPSMEGILTRHLENEQNRPVVMISLGIENSEQLIDPTSLTFTPQLLAALTEENYTGGPLATVHIGEPFDAAELLWEQQILQSLSEEQLFGIDPYLLTPTGIALSRVAAELPLSHQGIHAPYIAQRSQLLGQ